VPIHWDDLYVVRTLDRLEGLNRAYNENGEYFMNAVAHEMRIADACQDPDRVTFARLLYQLAASTPPRLHFEQMTFGNARLPQPQEHGYLQSLWHFQLTDSGRDRARARVVLVGFPEPDEDDGRTIPFLVLEKVAAIIARWYSPAQMPKFFYDSGLPQGPFDIPPDSVDKEKYAVDLLGILAVDSAESRRLIRRFMADLLNGALDVVLEPEDEDDLRAALAKAGWHPEGDTLVVGERIRTLTRPRAEPACDAHPLSGLHPLIVESCRELWDAGHRREAIGRAAVTLLDAVREASGLLGLDTEPLMSQAFRPEDPRIIVADLRTKNGQNVQRGTHFIAMGANAAIRNPAAHSNFHPDVDQAHEQLAVLSFLARRLDDARNAPPEWADALR
jgi:uncharacterized protein (TIGR02391 family)